MNVYRIDHFQEVFFEPPSRSSSLVRYDYRDEDPIKYETRRGTRYERLETALI